MHFLNIQRRNFALKIALITIFCVATACIINPITYCQLIQTFQLDWYTTSWTDIQAYSIYSFDSTYFKQNKITVTLPQVMPNGFNAYIGWKSYHSLLIASQTWIFGQIYAPQQIGASSFSVRAIICAEFIGNTYSMGMSVLIVSSYIYSLNKIYIEHTYIQFDYHTLANIPLYKSFTMSSPFSLTSFTGLVFLRGLGFRSRNSQCNQYWIRVAGISGNTVSVQIINYSSCILDLQSYLYTFVFFSNQPINACNNASIITFSSISNIFSSSITYNNPSIKQRSTFYGFSGWRIFNQNSFYFYSSLSDGNINVNTFISALRYQFLIITFDRSGLCNNNYFIPETDVCFSCINYVNLTGNTLCSKSCNKCCVQTQTCFECQSGLTLVEGGCTSQIGCNKVLWDITKSVCGSCMSPLVLITLNTSMNICKCPIHFVLTLQTTPFFCRNCPQYCKTCQVNATNNQLFCLQCFSQFFPSNMGKTCSCPRGTWPISNLCINIIGCLAAQKINNQKICLFCDAMKGFSLSNDRKKCICNSGYFINVIQKKCQQICGDGKKYVLQCDDGNNEDGDGCSSICKLQKQSKLSEKHFLNSVSVKNSQILNLNNNSALIKIQLVSQPFIDLDYRKFVKNISFKTDNKNTSVSSWQFVDGLLNINLDFYESIQSCVANLEIQFNLKIVNNLTKYNISMNSNNYQLHYQSFVPISYIQTSLQITKYLVPILVILSIFTSKTFAFEAIHVYQNLYFIYVFQNFEEKFNFLAYYSIFNINISQQPHQSNIFQTNNQLESTLYNLSQTKTILFYISLVILSLVCLKMVINFEIINTIYSKIYHRIMYPTLMSFYYLYFCQINNPYIKVQKITSIKNFAETIFFIFIIIRQFALPFFKKDNASLEQQHNLFGVTQCNKYYLTIYTIYISSIAIIVQSRSLNLISILSQPILLPTLLYLFYICYFMPYKSKLNNFTQMVNLCSLIVYCIYNILSRWLKLQQNFDVFNYFLITFLLTCYIFLLCSLIKIIIFIKNFTKNHFKSNKIQTIKKEIEDLPQDLPQDILYNHLIESQILDNIGFKSHYQSNHQIQAILEKKKRQDKKRQLLQQIFNNQIGQQ